MPKGLEGKGTKTMITQIRIYTINRGAMDDFLKHFHDETMPLHEKVGIPIVATFVHRPQNEFIWIRTYADDNINAGELLDKCNTGLNDSNEMLKTLK